MYLNRGSYIYAMDEVLTKLVPISVAKSKFPTPYMYSECFNVNELFELSHKT